MLGHAASLPQMDFAHKVTSVYSGNIDRTQVLDAKLPWKHWKHKLINTLDLHANIPLHQQLQQTYVQMDTLRKTLLVSLSFWSVHNSKRMWQL